jgi:hypothetical protein
MTLLALYGRERALRLLSLPLAYGLASAVLLDVAPALRARRLEAFPPADLWFRARTDGWLTDLAVVDAWATARTASLAALQLVAAALPALHRRERRRLLAHLLPLAAAPWVALAVLLQLALPLGLEILAAGATLPYAPPLRATRDAVLTAWLALSLLGPLVQLGALLADVGTGPRNPLRVLARPGAVLLALALAPDRPRAMPLALAYLGALALGRLLARALAPRVPRP